MHDPERFGEAVDRLRGFLGITAEPEGGDAAKVRRLADLGGLVRDLAKEPNHDRSV